MRQHKFFIVVREKDYKPFEKRLGRDNWGWELVDNVEIVGYTEAKKLLEEYTLAMPSHTVRLRIIR